jgi:lysophospholipase L1-like esterase
VLPFVNLAALFFETGGVFFRCTACGVIVLKARGITVIPESTAKLPLAYRQADKIHLTAEGHKLIAAKLLPRIIEVLAGPAT